MVGNSARLTNGKQTGNVDGSKAERSERRQFECDRAAEPYADRRLGATLPKQARH